MKNTHEVPGEAPRVRRMAMSAFIVVTTSPAWKMNIENAATATIRAAQTNHGPFPYESRQTGCHGGESSPCA